MVGSLVAAAVAAILTRNDYDPRNPDGKRLPEENESEDA
jgi:hypothetical protein